PWMTANADTFVHAMLAEAGVRNVFADAEDRFPTISVDALAAASPDVVVLPSEPFPFQARHADALAAATGLPRQRFVLLDGEACTWHGTGMAGGLQRLAAAVASWPGPDDRAASA
ncbi:MAG: cobalamin-binding protein, partial [Alphaproteobacteria bacterium]|nr:cobalamin-binding protein [Alphaproteobacteria bacterium]